MILITPLKTCRGFVKATNLEFFYLHSAMWILVTNMAASCFCLLPNVTSGGLRTIRIYQCSKCKNSREFKNAAIFGAYISFLTPKFMRTVCNKLVKLIACLLFADFFLNQLFCINLLFSFDWKDKIDSLLLDDQFLVNRTGSWLKSVEWLCHLTNMSIEFLQSGKSQLHLCI